MPGQKARSNTSVSYNSNELKSYVTQADLQRTIDQLETTSLGDTGKTFIAGDQSNTISLSGNWTKALDDILGPDAGSGTKRTVVITYTDSSNTVSYTWTSNGELSNYQIQSPANGLRTFSCELTLSGAPTRATT
jgi:hypothetical protein